MTPFTEDNVPKFEALPYTWGSPESPVNIFIGATGHRTLSVTRNLGETLQYLRHETNSRTLWIDAIYVNQQDPKERNEQVGRMADLFSKADRVVIWLRPESDNSSIAIECFQEISRNVAVDWNTRSMQPLGEQHHWADREADLPFTEAQFLAILRFLSRHWFERLWI
jgi:hypothetical protein